MEIARVLLLVLVILSLGYTLFAIYQLKVAKSNGLDTKREKGLSDCGTGQSVELGPSVVVLHGSINLRASVGSWVEIDFCHSGGKVPKDSMNEFCAHPPTVVHAKEKLIRNDMDVLEPAFQERDPRYEKKPRRYFLGKSLP